MCWTRPGQLLGQVCGRAGRDAVLLLVGVVPLHALGGDAAAVLGHLVERHLPDREHLSRWLPIDADVELAPFDVALDDRVGADALVDEARRARSASSSSSTTEACEMPIDASWVSDFTISGKLQPLRPPRPRGRRGTTAKSGHRDAVVGEHLLRQRLVARQHQAARVAAGVGHAQQLEVADDVLVERARCRRTPPSG